ncbi:MAG: hypothetical protein H7Z14_13780 [Anaerolineae bacterium]|nr:hypothetical protein [Phycisphaerae bacterium]
MGSPDANSLNVFQRLIRQFDAIHPYNAAQVMRLRGQADQVVVDRAWVETLSDLGIGPIRVVAKRFEQSGPTETLPDVKVLDPLTGDLAEQLTRGLNRPFNPNGLDPFRPFVLKEDQDSYWAGVVYQHRVADSVSIRMLLREWFLRMFDPQRARRVPLRIAKRGYWNRFGPGHAPWSVGGAVLDTMRWSARMKSARRIEQRDGFTGTDTHFSLHHLPDGLVTELFAVARANDVKINDLFLTAMARTCDRHIAARPTKKRYNLALGTIVDLRAGSREVADDEFGIFLGFTSVLCKRHHLNDWRALARSIAFQNRRSKKLASAESSQFRLAVTVLAGRVFSRESLLNWYRKRAPLCSGISNVNLNRTWLSKYCPDPVMEYVRVSPVGPMMPVVFTPSTLGEKLHFGLTCKTAIVSTQLARTIANDFSQNLIEIARAT